MASATRLRWDDLELVLALVRRGRIAAAAADLGVDATTVGRRLAALEKRSGSPFFERSLAGLSPTERTRAIATELTTMETGALAAESRLSAAPDVRGRVRIAVSDSTAMYFLMPVLEGLHTELPSIELELVTSAGIADLRRREADVALRFARPTQAELAGRRLTAVRWSLYGSASYLEGRARPDPERGLAGHRIVRWGGPPLRPTMHAWLDGHATAAEVALTVSGLHVMVEACAHGLGLAALPGPMALSRGLVRVIDHAIDSSETWLVVHKDQRRVPRVRAVADALGTRLHALRGKLGEI